MSADGAATEMVAGSANEAAVGDVLDNLKTFRHNYWAPVLLGFIMLFDSWDSIAIAMAISSIAREWSLDPLQMGVLISASYAGQFLGAVSLGSIAEKLGRMPVLLVAVVGMCLLAIACAMATGFNSLLAMRFLQGIMIGGALPVAITYINELAPTKTRGRYFGIFQTLAISGFSIAALAAPLIVPNPDLGWRWMLGLGAVPILLVPLVMITLPESPRWLARIGRLDEAARAVVKLGGKVISFPEPAGTGNAHIAAPQAKRASVLDLFAPELRFRTVTVTILWFVTMFVSFGLTTWAPSIFTKVYHFPEQRALNYIAIASALALVALASTGFLIDKYGRRPFALGGLSVAVVALMGMAIFNPSQELVIVSVVIAAKLGVFFGTYILWPYTAETFPTNARALALGYSSSIGRGASMLSPIFIGAVLNRGASIGIVFGSFGVFALIALVIWLTRTRETTGRRLDAI